MMRCIGIAAAMLLAASSASAATLTLVEGNVLVNTGKGFVKGVLGQELKPGDRVMIGNGGGNATIAYDVTCLARVVRASQVVRVQSGIPCTANSPAAAPEAGTGFAGVNTGTLVVGGAIAIGAGFGIYHLTKPSSP